MGFSFITVTIWRTESGCGGDVSGVWLGLELGLLWSSMQLDSPLVIIVLPPRLTFPMQGGHYAGTEFFPVMV